MKARIIGPNGAGIASMIKRMERELNKSLATSPWRTTGDYLEWADRRVRSMLENLAQDALVVVE